MALTAAPEGPSKGREGWWVIVDGEMGPTIVVGISGSPGSAAALRWAADEAHHRQCQLRIVLAWQPEQRAFYACPTGRPDGPCRQDEAVRRLAEIIHAVLGPGPLNDTAAAVVEGTAERALVAESARADLLVLGSGSATTIGPVIRTCLTDAHCPVVVVSQRAVPEHGSKPPRHSGAESARRDCERRLVGSGLSG